VGALPAPLSSLIAPPHPSPVHRANVTQAPAHRGGRALPGDTTCLHSGRGTSPTEGSARTRVGASPAPLQTLIPPSHPSPRQCTTFTKAPAHGAVGRCPAHCLLYSGPVHSPTQGSARTRVGAPRAPLLTFIPPSHPSPEQCTIFTKAPAHGAVGRCPAALRALIPGREPAQPRAAPERGWALRRHRSKP